MIIVFFHCLFCWCSFHSAAPVEISLVVAILSGVLPISFSLRHLNSDLPNRWHFIPPTLIPHYETISNVFVGLHYDACIIVSVLSFTAERSAVYGFVVDNLFSNVLPKTLFRDCGQHAVRCRTFVLTFFFVEDKVPGFPDFSFSIGIFCFVRSSIDGLPIQCYWFYLPTGLRYSKVLSWP